jgi:hypothetical protein
MRNLLVLICGLAFLTACASKSKVEFTHNGPAVVQTKSRSEPIFYNGKTYQLDYTYGEAQSAFDMRISGLGPKQQQDAMNIATSSLGYFACPDGQRGKIIGAPAYVDSKWALQAKCG